MLFEAKVLIIQNQMNNLLSNMIKTNKQFLLFLLLYYIIFISIIAIRDIWSGGELLNIQNLLIDQVVYYPFFIVLSIISFLISLYIHELGHYIVAKLIGCKDVAISMIGIRIGSGKIKIIIDDFKRLNKRDIPDVVFLKPKRMKTFEDIKSFRVHCILIGLSGVIANLATVIIIFYLLQAGVVTINNLFILSFIFASSSIIFLAQFGDIWNVIQGRYNGYHFALTIETYLLYDKYATYFDLLRFTNEDKEYVRFVALILKKELTIGLNKYSKNLKAFMFQTLIRASITLEEDFIAEELVKDFLRNNRITNIRNDYANISVDYQLIYSGLERLGYRKEDL